MSKDIINRRYPKVLADKLSRALHGVRDLDSDYWQELLARYRRNRAKYISANGVTQITRRSPELPNNLDFIPPEHIQAIERLNEAFEALHEYRGGGADQYLAKDVFENVANEVNSHLQSLRAKQPRTSEFDHEKIERYLRKRGYSTSDDKNEIIQCACDIYDAHPSTIRRIAKKTGLTRKKKITTNR